MTEAARLGDPIAHTHALRGLLIGAAVGAVIGITVVGTGGVAAVAVVGGMVSAGAGIGEMIGRFSCCTHNAGRIIEGSANVFINGRPAARASLSSIECDKHGFKRVAEGSSSVYINGMPAARVGDRSTCDGKISGGSSNVFIGGDTELKEKITPEVPQWLHIAMFGLAIGGGLGAIAKFGWRAMALGMAGGYAGEKGGHWLGGALFGEGSDWQKLTGLGGAIIGGAAAWGGYYRYNRNIAYNFFRSKGYSERDAGEYMTGYDFNRPVTVETLKPNTKVWQYQVEGGRKGNWFSPVRNVEPTKLGINPNAGSNAAPKVLHEYRTTQSVEVLRGTAARVKDSWSVPPPSKPYQAKGGAQQLFSPDKNAFELIRVITP